MFTLSVYAYRKECLGVHNCTPSVVPIIVDLAVLIIFGTLATVGSRGTIPLHLTRSMIVASIAQGLFFGTITLVALYQLYRVY